MTTREVVIFSCIIHSVSVKGEGLYRVPVSTQNASADGIAGTSYLFLA